MLRTEATPREGKLLRAVRATERELWEASLETTSDGWNRLGDALERLHLLLNPPVKILDASAEPESPDMDAETERLLRKSYEAMALLDLQDCVCPTCVRLREIRLATARKLGPPQPMVSPK